MEHPYCECRWYHQCLNEYGNINNLAEHRGIEFFVFGDDCWQETGE